MIRLWMFIPAALMIIACSNTPEAAPPPEDRGSSRPSHDTAGRLTVGFVIINGVYNSELMAPFDIFHHTVFHTDSGMSVFTIAPSDSIVTSFEGIRIIPDYTFDNHPRVDVLVVPSAEHNMDSDLDDERLIGFVRRVGSQARYILSLCDGAFILAQAGLLDGRVCTTFPSDVQPFRERFPQLDVREGVSFVHDRNAVTSVGGAKSYDPAMYLVELIYGAKVARGVGRGMVIDWNAKNISMVKIP